MSAHERERLSAYLDGELAPGERGAVETHLAACPECTALLAGLAAADQAAAALPVEEPEAYFETFAARVRARLQPRATASRARRVPAWTWAVAAAVVLAVVTPLTLRQRLPAAAEGPASTATPAAPTKAEPPQTGGSGAREPRAKSAAATGPRAGPPAAPPPAARPRPAPAPAAASAPEERKNAAAGSVFAREAPRGAARDQAVAPEAPADVEAEPSVGGAASAGALDREKAARAAPRSAVTAEAAAPMMSAATAGREAAPARMEQQENAFGRLEAQRPRTAAGWRRVREQWNALAAAEGDAGRADEARVRAVVAAREAWLAGGDERDAAAFRAEAESYLRREDARQRPRVEALLAEAVASPAP